MQLPPSPGSPSGDDTFRLSYYGAQDHPPTLPLSISSLHSIPPDPASPRSSALPHQARARIDSATLPEAERSQSPTSPTLVHNFVKPQPAPSAYPAGVRQRHRSMSDDQFVFPPQQPQPQLPAYEPPAPMHQQQQQVAARPQPQRKPSGPRPLKGILLHPQTNDVPPPVRTTPSPVHFQQPQSPPAQQHPFAFSNFSAPPPPPLAPLAPQKQMHRPPEPVMMSPRLEKGSDFSDSSHDSSTVVGSPAAFGGSEEKKNVQFQGQGQPQRQSWGWGRMSAGFWNGEEDLRKDHQPESEWLRKQKKSTMCLRISATVVILLLCAGVGGGLAAHFVGKNKAAADDGVPDVLDLGGLNNGTLANSNPSSTTRSSRLRTTPSMTSAAEPALTTLPSTAAVTATAAATGLVTVPAAAPTAEATSTAAVVPEEEEEEATRPARTRPRETTPTEEETVPPPAATTRPAPTSATEAPPATTRRPRPTAVAEEEEEVAAAAEEERRVRRRRHRRSSLQHQ